MFETALSKKQQLAPFVEQPIHGLLPTKCEQKYNDKQITVSANEICQLDCLK